MRRGHPEDLRAVRETPELTRRWIEQSRMAGRETKRFYVRVGAHPGAIPIDRLAGIFEASAAEGARGGIARRGLRTSGRRLCPIRTHRKRPQDATGASFH